MERIESKILVGGTLSFWKYNERKSQSFIAKRIILDDSVATRPEEVCYMFAKFFKSAFFSSRVVKMDTLVTQNIPITQVEEQQVLKLLDHI